MSCISSVCPYSVGGAFARRIRRRYFRTWFSVDVLACFPSGYLGRIFNHEASVSSGEPPAPPSACVRLVRRGKGGVAAPNHAGAIEHLCSLHDTHCLGMTYLESEGRVNM